MQRHDPSQGRALTTYLGTSSGPPDVARRRVRDAMPPGARPGDLLTADEGGARMKLRVICEAAGQLSRHPGHGLV
jgi:hypothetical protein